MAARVTGPLFKWFGSKWLSSVRYPTPDSETLVEPFAGGAGYSLRHCDKRVILAEANEYILSLWFWLIRDATQDDIMRIPVNLPEGLDIRNIGLSVGQSLLLKNWQRTNNVGNCWTVSPWGNKPGQWTENTRARVAEEFQAVRHWTVFDSGLAVIRGMRDAECSWFIDPPYQYNYQYRRAPLDLVALGGDIRALRGQVVVCEALCPKTGRVPNWLPFDTFGKSVTSRRKVGENTHSKEVIYKRDRHCA